RDCGNEEKRYDEWVSGQARNRQADQATSRQQEEALVSVTLFGLLQRQPDYLTVNPTPDVPTIGVRPLSGDIDRCGQFPKTQSMVMWHNAEKMHTYLGRDQHVAGRWLLVRGVHRKALAQALTKNNQLSEGVPRS